MKKRQNTQTQLLKLLSDGHFHSGETLGEQLGMTRSAIWKAIKQLQSAGVDVESNAVKGYRIPNGLDLLDESNIRSHIHSNKLSQLDDLQLLQTIDSTNDYLLSRIDTMQTKTIACFAEQQTRGKGRRGRQWVSPFGNNIYYSLLWHFNKDPSELMGLSLAVAVATTRALQAYGINTGIALKWPNDILWQSQKLAGILIEMMATPHEACAVVVGIGINTRLSEKEIKALNRPVTSIEKITNNRADRNRLAGLLLDSLIDGLQEFENQGLSAFLNEWQALDAFRGKVVTLETAGGFISGTMEGVSEKGELLLLNDDGESHPYLSGEVSLHGG